MKHIIIFLSVIFLSEFSLAFEIPFCKTGALPAIFHGSYKTTSSNTFIRLTADKMYFEGFQGAFLKVTSCVHNQKRIMSLLDGEPNTAQNLIVLKLPNGNLIVEDLETREVQTWIYKRTK